MSQQLPPGHGPVDPAAAFNPPGAGAVSSGPGIPGRGSAPAIHASGPIPGGPMPGGPMPSGPMPGAMYGGPMPGPMMQGPMFYPPMPPGFPPPPRRGWGKVIIILILLFALGISILVNFVQLSGSFTSTSDSKQTTLVSGDLSTKIAVVPIEGLIDDSQAKQFSQLLDDVEKESDITA
jgi:hypothetical protein